MIWMEPGRALWRAPISRSVYNINALCIPVINKQHSGKQSYAWQWDCIGCSPESSSQLHNIFIFSEVISTKGWWWTCRTSHISTNAQMLIFMLLQRKMYYPLIVHYWADFKSMYGFHCYGNIHVSIQLYYRLVRQKHINQLVSINWLMLVLLRFWYFCWRSVSLGFVEKT